MHETLPRGSVGESLGKLGSVRLRQKFRPRYYSVISLIIIIIVLRKHQYVSQICKRRHEAQNDHEGALPFRAESARLVVAHQRQELEAESCRIES